MSPPELAPSRLVPAVPAARAVEPDGAFELGLAEHLRASHTRSALVELYSRFVTGEGQFDGLMRKVLFRAIAKRVGNGLQVSAGVAFRHLETFEIGDAVFLGAQAYLQGRFDGRCVIGDHTWIGPQAYFDARDLELGEYVGWAPGARVLGSVHTAQPADIPVLRTDLVIRPVRVEDWADVGVGAVLLPGVTVGRGAIVGAGAVVTDDVLPFAVVAGVPARFLHWREGHEPEKSPR